MYKKAASNAASEQKKRIVYEKKQRENTQQTVIKISMEPQPSLFKGVAFSMRGSPLNADFNYVINNSLRVYDDCGSGMEHSGRAGKSKTVYEH